MGSTVSRGKRAPPQEAPGSWAQRPPSSTIPSTPMVPELSEGRLRAQSDIVSALGGSQPGGPVMVTSLSRMGDSVAGGVGSVTVGCSSPLHDTTSSRMSVLRRASSKRQSLNYISGLSMRDDVRPEVISAVRELAAILEELEQQAACLREIDREIRQREELLASHRMEIDMLEVDIQQELAEVGPELEVARGKLRIITNAEVTEILAISKPPQPLVLTMDVLLAIVGISAKPGDWGAAKKLISKPELIESLLKIEPDSLSSSVSAKLKPYIDSEKCKFCEVVQVSSLGGALSCWIHAMEMYHNASVLVASKRRLIEDTRAMLIRLEAEMSLAKDRRVVQERKVNAIAERKKEKEKEITEMEQKTKQV